MLKKLLSMFKSKKTQEPSSGLGTNNSTSAGTSVGFNQPEASPQSTTSPETPSQAAPPNNVSDINPGQPTAYSTPPSPDISPPPPQEEPYSNTVAQAPVDQPVDDFSQQQQQPTPPPPVLEDDSSNAIDESPAPAPEPGESVKPQPEQTSQPEQPKPEDNTPNNFG